jgi:hypothetical protein
MGLNINGYAVTNSSGLTFGSSSTKVDSSGRMFVQNLPAMFGSRTGGQATYRAYPWPINSTAINVNTVFSTSTYVFTCPVAGLYFTSCSLICNGTNSTTATTTGSGYVGLIKNGVLQTFSHWNTNDSWDCVNLESILSCAAGDTISFAVNTAPSPSGSTYGAYGDNHNMATIWLIG